MKNIAYFILLTGLFCLCSIDGEAQHPYKTHQDSIEQRLKERYTKREVMIPMRDGVKLYTAVYEPKNNDKCHPILMHRSPYSCAPYGPEHFARHMKSSLDNYVNRNYIIVYQDIRGRYKSEGEFVQVRPLNKNKKGPKDKKNIDEATDTYDTIEWLLKNTHNNGNVGTWGISYDGFQATMTASSNHPALKAVSPQAPVTDWFRGDDRHHNGAFTLLQTTNFLPDVEGRHMDKGVMKEIVKNDVYTDFLNLGTFKNVDEVVNDSTCIMWNDIKNHPNFDEFWKERDARTSCYNLRPAILVVGGLYDSEDCYGAWGLYRAIKKQSPETELYLAFGPWWHGAWTRREFQGFGNIYFGNNSSAYYMDHIQYPFFRYYLENEGEKPKNKVSIFYSGKNDWEFYDEWPRKDMIPTPYYIHEDGSVSTKAPTEKKSYTEYVSDMEHPVPYTANPTRTRTKEFMVDDQRFATSRPDVITFVTAPLTDTLTLAGPIEVELQTAISSTDADFMVKVIDVFPENFRYPKEATDYLKNTHYPMSGYQLMVRGELFRGRFRTGFDRPQPFTPNKITPVNYTLYDVAHTFLPGHRLMIQIQSSWFPIIDRNPQKFIDTYHCTIEDFVMKQNIKIFHQEGASTRLILSELEALSHEHQLPADLERCVLVFHIVQTDNDRAYDLLKDITPLQERDVLVDMDRHTVVLLKDVSEENDLEELSQFAQALQETLMGETAHQMTIGIGRSRHTMDELRESYMEARRAIEVGRIFKPEESIFVYSRLILERFLMELPQDISAYYHGLLFNRKNQRLFNEEMLYTIDMFFKKDLNLSDTARQLYIHRNTLVYRLDKVQKQIGLDLRSFEDAVTFKILMELKKVSGERSSRKS